jgi:alpha-mannosidase/mannosylglycerate hydrolase
VIYNAGGRLGVGPWYVIVDSTLVNAESLIRNLLAARADANQHGLKLMPVAYNPDAGGHIAHLPQILDGCGINAAFLRYAAPVSNMPFRWEAPDGSSILAFHHEFHNEYPYTEETRSDISASLQSQRAVRPDGPFLWMFDAENSTKSLVDLIEDINDKLNVEVQQSDLPGYVRDLRQEMPDTMRPAVKGELRLQPLREHAYLFPGTLSSRIYLKQANARLQARLTYAVEPWLTVAVSHGAVRFPENMRALLNYSWRLLMKNQAHNALAGVCSDAVHEENEMRFRQAEDSIDRVIRGTLSALSGAPHQPGTPTDPDQTYITVWNGHNWTVNQVSEIKLELPRNRFPFRVVSPDGEELTFSWESLDSTLSFVASVPGFGYSAYKVELSDEPPAEDHIISRTRGSVIGNVFGETLTAQGGKLIWKRDDNVIEDLLRFLDGGDAGDVYNYSPPDPDAISEADMISDVEVESSPFYERLVIHHRMRIASALRPDRSRARGVKLVDLTTTVTLYDHIPGVYFHTTYENAAQDHRLRAHLRTNISNQFVLAGSAIGIVERPAVIDGQTLVDADSTNMEAVINTQPLHEVVAVQGKTNTMALLVKGLPEYEAIPEDEQLTIAITLLRAVGWLNRDDLRTRSASIAPSIEVPGAQCLREMEADYALISLPSSDRAGLIRAGEEFNAPLQVYQYDEPPERPTRSFLSIVSDKAIGAESDGDGAIVTAFKPPEKGNGWIVRLFNPHNNPVEVYITPYTQPERVYRVTLSEEAETFIEPDANGRILVTIEPHQIFTVRMMFND